MQPENQAKTDFSVFLMVVNAVVAASIIFLFFFRGTNEYVSAYTVCLSFAFAAQSHFFLLMTKRRPNPFLLLLVMYSVFFYEFRIATLLLEPWSTVFVRNAFGAADLSNGLLFIILANFCIFLGVDTFAENGFEPGLRENSGVVSVWLFPPILFFLLGMTVNLDFSPLSFLKGYIWIIFNPDTVLLFGLVFVALYYEALDKWQKIVMLCMAIVFVAYKTHVGSRSAMLMLFFYSFCAWFAVKGRVELKKKAYLILTALAPLTFCLFILATLVVRKSYPEVPFKIIFDRMGMLDMGAEVISGTIPYRSVVNFAHYFKSIVDSGLTPGFNVFDAPKAANVLSFIYNGMPEISLQAVSVNYQSDIMTVYGEAYALFGPIAGLAGIFVISFLFQKVYRALSFREPFRQAALKATVLVIFYTYFLGSFGIDWFVVDVVRAAVPFFMLLSLYSMCARNVPGRASGGFE